MPDLPTLTINDQATFDRVSAAFGTASAYRQWLRARLREYVRQAETSQALIAKQTEIDNLPL